MTTVDVEYFVYFEYAGHFSIIKTNNIAAREGYCIGKVT